MWWKALRKAGSGGGRGVMLEAGTVIVDRVAMQASFKSKIVIDVLEQAMWLPTGRTWKTEGASSAKAQERERPDCYPLKWEGACLESNR